MLLEEVYHHGSERDAATALLRLWLRLDVPVAGSAREDTPNVQRIVREVNVLPLESQDPPATHPSREGQDEERLQVRPVSSSQQLLGLFYGKWLNLKVRPARR